MSVRSVTISYSLLFLFLFLFPLIPIPIPIPSYSSQIEKAQTVGIAHGHVPHEFSWETLGEDNINDVVLLQLKKDVKMSPKVRLKKHLHCPEQEHFCHLTNEDSLLHLVLPILTHLTLFHFLNKICFERKILSKFLTLLESMIMSRVHFWVI